MISKKKKLESIVGSGNVLDDQATLDAYSKDESFIRGQSPQYAVSPANTNEVQGIVKWANENSTPLVPISSGSPHFHGDTVPTTAGAAIVDLTRMKRILKIDRRNRMTIIEPGVTYNQLQPELAREGLRLSMPLLPRNNKSVIASLLEREPILTPRYQRTMIEPLRCLEVVWGNGDKFWTGEAGGHPLSLEEQWEKKWAQVNPMGPGQTDYFRFVSAAQGSMGIITWASIKCEILPQLHKVFFIQGKKLEDLIECAYKLLRVRLGDEFLLLNNIYLANMLGATSTQIQLLVKELPPWVIVLGISGRDVLPEERIELQKKAITDIAQQFGLQLRPTIPGAKDSEVLELITNPSRVPYWKLNHKKGCQDILFLTTLNKTSELIKTMSSVAETYKYSASELGIYVQPLHQGVSCHCEFMLTYDSSDYSTVNNIQTLINKASIELINHNAFFSRPYGIWANMVYDRDKQTTTILKKVKGLFDPNNVMNPGKLCF